MTDQTPRLGSTDDSSAVLAKLRAHREQHSGEETLTLPTTGVVVTYPSFRPYSLWQRAQRLGGKDGDRMQLHYIVALCRFDGERLRANDYAELIPSDDHIAIVSRIFGGAGDDQDGEAEGGEGKDPAPGS